MGSGSRSVRSGGTAVVGTVILLIVGVLVFHRTILEGTGLWVDGGAPTVDPSVFQAPEPTLAGEPGNGVIEQAPVLADTNSIDPAVLAQKFAQVETKGLGSQGVEVVDIDSGEKLYGNGSDKRLTPASTMKVLTTLSATKMYGPHHRFTTKIVQIDRQHYVLVGGGDPYFASSAEYRLADGGTATTLAGELVELLREQGVTKIRLDYDDSLFTGPMWNPTWPDSYSDQLTRTSALWIDQGRPDPDSGPSADPAKAAAETFSELLDKLKVSVTNEPESITAPATGTIVAQTQSAMLQDIAARVLQLSDNSGAEVLFRHIAVADGKPGSIEQAQAVQTTALQEFGIDAEDMRIVDGSGLSRDNRLTARSLVIGLRSAAEQPELRTLIQGLPTAGATGTLRNRFANDEATPGKGWVRAKTGTLRKVSSLAGITTTSDGQEVAFAFIVNGGKDEYRPRPWADEMATVVTTCGCKG